MQKLLLPIAIVLIIGFGVWEGLWADRWTVSQDLVRATERVAGVPSAIGDWMGEDREMDSRQVERAEITGYLLRNYTHKHTGATLQVLLVCGRAGPTSLHPPDICYQGAGYQLDAPAVRHSVKLPASSASADFWMGKFQKNGAVPDPLRIYWSWNANGKWNAADNPRWTFGGYQFLYKLYIIRALTRIDEPLSEDPVPKFLPLFLPQLHETLFGTADRRAPAAALDLPGELSSGRRS